MKLTMSLAETCPFCGKPFKRLKSHLPHCKMSPVSKNTKITTKPKGMPTTNFQHKSNKDKINKVNTDTELNHPTFQADSKSQVKSKSKIVEKASVDKEFLQNTPFTLASTPSKDPSTEDSNMNTFKPKTKWLVKREQEMLKRAKLQTKTRTEFTSVSRQEKHNNETYKRLVNNTPLLEKEIANGQKQLSGNSLTSELSELSLTSDPLLSVTWPTGSQAQQIEPKGKANANVSKQIQNSPNPLTKEYTLASIVKEQSVCVFHTKTFVWDHIKHGLYKRRCDCVSVLLSITSESVLNPCTVNDQNATMKTLPVQGPISQTSVQRPVEEMLSSRVQKMPIMAFSPEMATGYGGTFFWSSSHSEMSSNDNLLTKCQTAKPFSQSQGLKTEPRLGDVRLNELASWLGARTPREAVTMFNKGWQWYYKKYIDVQKGGIGGIAMLIGGYCVLSYIWSYPHIKKHRWRKYH